ncbi:hypothetical protein IGI04_038613 [Brassica rapa subsp. trilocularis]|uniref:Cyclin-like domain-containing protein n=1 Tax=Brassica rapa subsp. trilocularis TaxID=1813537 RepID=A0ABQ7LKP0_BRACM|nr:hypothetical protein IGI04_038613 [Brassica rapa subsp. trilocularis]
MKVIASRNSKRKAGATPFAAKNLPSMSSIRKRALISPLSAASGSNLLSAVDDNVSCGSSRVEESSKLKKIRIEEEEEEVSGPADPKLRRITRSYSKVTKEKEGDEIEVSETSFTRSDVTFAENKESDVVSGVESCSKFGSVTGGGGGDYEETEISKPSGHVEAKTEVVTIGFVSDLACAETFSDEEDESSEIFSQYSSDYTSSIFSDSGSEFSERSSSDDSPVSHTRSLYLAFKEQFCRSTIPNDLESSREELSRETQSDLLRFEDEEVEESYQRLRERERSHAYLRDCAKAYCSRMDHSDFIPQLRLIMVQWIVEVEHLLSFSSSSLWCSFVDNCLLTDFTQQCSAMELQPETLFLGVSLLDRFLSKGTFKSERTLVLVGIASLTLATRIEENQPYNSIRRRNFYIQNLKYSRHEVVAMEWLVQEVLNFKCLSPTIFNFLWFYLKAARANPEVEKKARSLAITSLSDHTQLCFWPSTVAAGLVVLACSEHNKISAYQRVIKVHVRTKDNDLPECVESLEWLLEQ